MRVTIQHREESGPEFFVDCTVRFSEEEKAVLRTRDIGPGLFFPPPRKPPSEAANIWWQSGDGHMAGFVLSVGFLIGVVSLILGSSFVWLGSLMMASSPIVWAIFKYNARRVENATNEQLVLFEHLFAGQPFTVWAHSPSNGKDIEEQITKKLTGLKAYINDNVSLGEKRTYEL